MIVRNFEKGTNHSTAEAGVWLCENCSSFHVKIGDLLVTFTRAEFGAFSSAVFDTYASALTFDDIQGTGTVETGILGTDHLVIY